MIRPASHRNLWLLTWALVAGLMLVGVRLFDVQVVRPQEPTPFSANDPDVKRIRPARRGEIRDANGTVLVQSQTMVEIRADPVRLGAFATDVARLAAVHLQMPEEELLARFKPIYFQSTQQVVVTNRGIVSTNLQVVYRPMRNNLVATNVAPEVWDRLSAALRTNRFHAEIELADRRRAVLDRAREQVVATPVWNLPERWAISRGKAGALKALKKTAKLVETNLTECKANGLYAEYFEKRRYPFEHMAAHVLGFTTNKSVAPRSQRHVPVELGGAQGIEQRFDEALVGKHGVVMGQTVGGREYVPLRERDIAAVDGLNVHLTLDVQIQEAVERALDDAVARLHPLAISAVVVRPRTGDILALANRPTFNPNDRSIRLIRPGADPLSAFKNRAINEPFEPGSTFKILTYAAVLNEGLASIDEVINCHGGRWTVPGTRRLIRDDQGHHIGEATVEKAFAQSSNVGAVMLGLRVPTNRFVQYIRDFGFLSRTGIECGEESIGYRRVPVRVSPGVTNYVTNQVVIYGERGGTIPSWDGWTPSSLPFGYGLRVTPLQSVMAAAAIANDGILLPPRLVRELRTSDGQLVREFPVPQGRRVIHSETARKMVGVMRAAVEKGTGGQAALAEFEVAGKTGTAKKFVKGGYDASHYFGSFVGFFPMDHPEAAIIVTVDEPKSEEKSYYGGKAAAPVFRQIALEVANVLKLMPTIQTTNSAALRLPGARTLPAVVANP